MTQVFTIEPNPHWVIIDNFSKLPNGAAIYTYRHLNPSEFKPAFVDPAGATPYGQPIVGFGNGTMPPIYWEFDDTAPQETYYIQVWDKVQAPGNNAVMLWDFDGLSGGGSGGGGTIVTNDEIENLIVNGQFFRNIGNLPVAPATSLPTLITLAPSNNAGFVGVANNPPNQAPPSPDIIFAKFNQSDTDTLKFVPVVNGTNNFLTNPTPKFFVEYNCTVGGTGQTYKYIQIPVVLGLQNLTNATVATQIFARLQSGNPTDVTLTLRLFMGNGGSPSGDIVIPLGGGPITLSNSWDQIIIPPTVVPSIAGLTLGTCGNDALYFQINFPSSDPIDVQFILPGMYLSNIPSNIDFHTLDQVDAIVNSPRTGDVRTSLNSFLLGWVNMNDGTIGNASSNATTRANIDTFPLFNLIWNTFQGSQALAPMYSSAGAPVAYGASPVADFTANNQISLTRNLGRVMAGSLPIQVTQAFTTPSANILTVASTASFITGAPVTVSSSTVPQLVNGTTYYAIVLGLTTMSLATSAANAIASTPINFAMNAGTGNVIIAAHALGSFLGGETQVIAATNLPSRVDGSITAVTLSLGGTGTAIQGIGNNAQPPTSTRFALGSDTPLNIMQPTVFMNVFMKL